MKVKRPTSVLGQAFQGFGFVLVFGGLLVNTFAFASLGVNPKRSGLDWWLAALGKLFRFPDPGWLSCLFLGMTLWGLFVIGRAIVQARSQSGKH